MKEKAVDRRVSRTKSMVLDAFLDLIIEKGYEKTTVQDIIDRANIGRSTFYLHFTDKEHLLECNIDQLQTFLLEQSHNEMPASSHEPHRFGFSLAMLEHAQSHIRLYKAIVRKQDGSTVIYHMHNMIVDLVSDEIGRIQTMSKQIPNETVIDFVANTFMLILTWWMNHDIPCSALEADSIFHKLVFSGLGTLIG